MQSSLIRVIPCNDFGAQWNMAADEYLLTQSSTPVLRFYQWSLPTLSFGRSNAKFSDINFSTIAHFDIQGVIRQTGGKTVLHHKELTYAFITQNISLGILDCYKKIASILQKAFVKFGVHSQIEKKEKNHNKGLICFQEVSSYEVEVQGKKLVGSAQKRKKNHLLQHGSILLDLDFAFWSSVWKVAQQDLKSRIVSFQQLVGEVKTADLADAIIKEFCKQFHLKAVVENFNVAEQKKIDELSLSYYWKEFEMEKQKIKTNENKK